MVSVGNSGADILKFIDENYLCGDVACRRNLKRWKGLVRDIKGSIENVNNLKCNTRGTVIEDDDLRDDPVMIMLLTPDFDVTSYEDMITLAHECLHVCQRILPLYLKRDVEHEAEAYFHSYLMRECVRIINEG